MSESTVGLRKATPYLRMYKGKTFIIKKVQRVKRLLKEEFMNWVNLREK